MPVIFRGESVRPAPQVSLSKNYAFSGDGRKIGAAIAARLSGTLAVEKVDDTYTPKPLNEKLSTVLEKQEHLRTLFSQDGLFEIQGFDASPPMKFFGIVESIEFSEGPWTDKSDYTVSLRSAGIFGEDDDSPNCETVSESWTFEEGDLPRSWKATHSVSAKGKLVYDAAGNIPKLPWEIARDFVEDKLGIDWTTPGDVAWSRLSGQELAEQSTAMPLSTTAWNRVVQETIDETEGTYAVTETFTLSDNPWIEEYVVSTRRVNEPNITSTASISGTIHGLRGNMLDVHEKYNNAAIRWITVKDLLATRCQTYAGDGTTYNSHPIAFSSDHDEFNGTIQYQAEFNDQVYVNDTYETYNISQSVSDEDYHTTVRVEGIITGAVYLDDGPSKTIKFTRASLQWEIVKTILLARVIQETGLSSLKPFPVSAQVTPDKNAGTVSYTYEFTDQTPSSVKHEYTVTKRYSRDDGADVVSIEGTISGLRTAHATSPFGTGDTNERYNNALAFWTGMSDNVLGLAAQYVTATCVNTLPMSTSVGHNPLAGTISYSSEFSSRILPSTPGALSETVTIQDDDATPLIAIIPVLGRAAGPVIQDLGSVKEKRRTVSIEIVMSPPKFYCSPTVDKPTVNISNYVPQGTVVYKEQDQTSWVPNTGRFSRTVSWIYE